jgi:hypothetical protein
MAKGPVSALFSLRNGSSMVPLSDSLPIKLWRPWSGSAVLAFCGARRQWPYWMAPLRGLRAWPGPAGSGPGGREGTSLAQEADAWLGPVQGGA